MDIIGAIDFTDGVRLLIAQEAVAGNPATTEQIKEFFESAGWKRFFSGAEDAWFDEAHSIVVSDTHQANLILTEEGILAPIDLRIQRVDGSIKDSVLALT